VGGHPPPVRRPHGAEGAGEGNPKAGGGPGCPSWERKDSLHYAAALFLEGAPGPGRPSGGLAILLALVTLAATAKLTPEDASRKEHREHRKVPEGPRQEDD